MVVPELVLGGTGGSSPWEVEAFAELKGSCVGVNVRLSRSFALPMQPAAAHVIWR